MISQGRQTARYSYGKYHKCRTQDYARPQEKTAKPVVKCKVHFTGLELCLIKSCPGQRMFKLKCQLWGKDSGLTGGDDFLYTYPTVFYFPDATPTSPESRTFEDTVGEGHSLQFAHERHNHEEDQRRLSQLLVASDKKGLTVFRPFGQIPLLTCLDQPDRSGRSALFSQLGWTRETYGGQQSGTQHWWTSRPLCNRSSLDRP